MNKSSSPRIVVIDDEQGMRDMLNYELSHNNYNVRTFETGAECLNSLKEKDCDIVITDIKMPNMTGVDLLHEIKELNSEIEVIMTTGFGTIETAIQSLKEGAFDYIRKPFNIAEILTSIERALEKQRLRAIVTLYELSKEMFSTIKIDELLEKVVNLSLKSLGADDSSIMLFDSDNKLYVAASERLDKNISSEIKLAVGERIAGKIAEEKHAVLLINGLKDDPRFKDIQGYEDIKSALVIPLLFQDKLLGVLNISRINIIKNFTEHDLQKAVIFGSLVAMAVENADMYRKLMNSQAQLIQAEKIASIGQLASGIAHEINNPLGGILGYSQLILEDMDETDPLYSDIKEIESACKRCKVIVEQLLTYARQGGPEFKAVDVNKVIESALALISHQMKLSRIEIDLQTKKDLPDISGNFQQLEQVIMNLVTNARDAMPDGGNITITTGLEIKDSTEGVVITVRDTGMGMSPDVLKKIMDPFYTTKPVGKGTGLGLSVSQGIIDKHKGVIESESREGAGTTFLIRIPVSKNHG